MVKKDRKKFSFLGHPILIIFFLIISVTMILLLNMETLTFSSKNLETITGGLSILDTRLFYNQVDIFNFLEKLGEQGRNAYQLTHLFPDFIFPITYSLFFVSASIWLSMRLDYSRKQTRRVFLLTLLAGIFDLLENFTIIALVAAFPQQHPALALAAQIFTLIKFGFFIFNISLLLFLSLRLVKKNLPK